MLDVVQLSDTHFGPDGHRSHGGFGYDTDAAFAAVVQHLGHEAPPDLFVVTGDIADRGRADEYAKAQGALSSLPGPVNLCPGNHDLQVPFQAGLVGSGLTQLRTMTLGSWLFVFADSNFDGREPGPGDQLVDAAERVGSRGLLGPAEVDWIDRVCTATNADHIFVWLHHPPAFGIGQFDVPSYNEEVMGVLQRQDRIRGLAGGHIHTNAVRQLVDRPVFVCPALTINIDFEAETTLPPGYRRYRFDDDGLVHSVCHLIDDSRWPRIGIPDAGMRFLRGLD